MTAKLADETKGLLSRERIAAMKPGVILVNTARGALVDEEAMIEALRSGHIRPGLDVFAVEPMPAGHILTTYGRCAIGFGLFPRDVRAFKGHALFEPRLAPPTADHVGLALGSHVLHPFALPEHRHEIQLTLVFRYDDRQSVGKTGPPPFHFQSHLSVRWQSQGRRTS